MSRSTVIALTLATAAGGGLLAVNNRGPSGDEVYGAAVPTVVAGSQAATTSTLVEAPPIIGDAPALEGLDGWLNTTATSPDEFDNQVRIVQFWTYGCVNCKRTLENLKSIYAQHGNDSNFEIIGVHAPEFDHEAEVGNIIEAADQLGVVWPIALDTNKTNFRSWQEGRRFWPRTYVIDSLGRIRFDHIGEGAYEELGATVDWLLANES